MSRPASAHHTRMRQPVGRGRGYGRRGSGLRSLRPRRVLDLLRRVSELLDTVVDPEVAAWTVLVAYTAGEGLGFNRAFLLLAEREQLRGWFGVGPRSREEARELWAELRRREVLPLDRLSFQDLDAAEGERQRHAQTLSALTHPLVRGCSSWRHAFIGRSNHPNPCIRHWANVLDSRELVVVPLMGGERPWGVVLADNFVTHASVYSVNLEAAETLGHYLRSALERTQLLRRFQEEKRRRMMAEHATALLETARTLAHDLKNPLALAGGRSRELLSAPPAGVETVVRQLGIIAAAVDQAERRVTDLVNGLTSRADGIALGPVEVGGLAERVTEAFRPLAASRRVRLLLYHPARSLVVAAAVPPLERCLENLLANALEALGEEGGTIQVGAREDPPWVRLEVADNGLPLPAFLRPDPFAGGVTTHRRGSGLGLASVRTLVEAMGGKVEYDEREPGWVRFTMLLRRWS
jgi:signal transduction histidine kinase